MVELAEHGIRFDLAGGRVVDATVPCRDVYWAVDARARGRLVTPLATSIRPGRVSRGPGVRDGWIRRQYIVLRDDSGLGRGFSQYHDFIFPDLTALRITALVSRALEGTQSL